MKKTTVLVVDDSATIRHLLTEILSRDPEIEVIGQGIDQHLAEFAACQQSGDWPGYGQEPVHLTLEDWQL